MELIAVITGLEIALFAFVLVFVFCGFAFSFFFERWRSRHLTSSSPYSGLPLRRATDVPEEIREKILKYLYDLHQYDNQMFDPAKAAVCRETQRIFPDAVTWYDTIKVDWSFLQKRHPGNYVSWGSLSVEQQREVMLEHDSLDGYQLQISSPYLSPRVVEPQYAYTVPGPLYVDLEKKTLLGWKVVPQTDFEILIVQKPRKKIDFHKEYIEKLNKEKEVKKQKQKSNAEKM